MEATGVLLLGGLSRRFGSVKALAPLGTEMLAERAWRILGEAFQDRLAVGKDADRLGLPFPLLDDGIRVRSPIAGVIGGLRASPTEIAVFLPVDCPLMTSEALHALAANCAEAAVPQTGPLPGAYARSALDVLEQCLEAGRLDLSEALSELDTRTVEIDPGLLTSVNTERDLDRLRARARS
jgi:molybdopterin-guanine dinucleotide biosynthesis protein A